MDISLSRRSGFDLIIMSDNVRITEDIEERVYSKTAEGKNDFKSTPLRDISNDSLEQITRLLDDMIYFRKRHFNSSELIERLFDKLSEEDREALLLKLEA